MDCLLSIVRSAYLHSNLLCFLSEALIEFRRCVFECTFPFFLLHLACCWTLCWAFQFSYCIPQQSDFYLGTFLYFVWLWWHFLCSSILLSTVSIFMSISLNFYQVNRLSISVTSFSEVLSCSFWNTFLFSLVLLASQLCVYALYKRASSPLPEGPALPSGCLSKLYDFSVNLF